MLKLDFALLMTGILLAASAQGRASAGPIPFGSIMTVQGPVAPEKLGAALSHEHIMSIFGAEPAETPSYGEERLLAAVVPALREVRAQGVRTIFEATAAYFGRDPSLLRRIAGETGLHLVTNTGFYGAANGRYLPPGLVNRRTEEIAEGWIAEFRDGIGPSAVRPGFIKLGINAGPLREIDRRLMVAAAQTHHATGLTIAVHTGANVAAVAEQLAILAEAGVSPEAWIWVHAHQVTELPALLQAARVGAWISLDGWSAMLASRHLEILRHFKDQQLLHRVLLSQDGNLFPAAGGKPRPLNELYSQGRAAIRAAGFTESEWRLLTTTNPAAAFALKCRLVPRVNEPTESLPEYPMPFRADQIGVASSKSK